MFNTVISVHKKGSCFYIGLVISKPLNIFKGFGHVTLGFSLTKTSSTTEPSRLRN